MLAALMNGERKRACKGSQGVTKAVEWWLEWVKILVHVCAVSTRGKRNMRGVSGALMNEDRGRTFKGG